MGRPALDQKRKPPRTQTVGSVRHPGLCVAQLSCKVGRNVIEGKTNAPDGVPPIEWAMFNLLHAVEEIAKAMMPDEAEMDDGIIAKKTRDSHTR